MSKYAMHSGHLIDINNFTADDVIFDDIAHHLSMNQRYNGSLPLGIRYSVAEHSINLVQYILKEHNDKRQARWALLHDASEAYLSDIVSDVKKNLKDYLVYERHVQSIIEQKYLGHYLASADSGYHNYDKRIIIDEVQAIMPDKYDIYKKECNVEPLGIHIHYNNHPATVKQCFLTLSKELEII